MKIIGHRGAAGLAPENTLASFEKALAHNVAEIECDAHVTADGVIILAHDPELHSPGGQTYIIRNYTHAELLAFKPDVTTLEAAVAFIDRRVPLMIEVKPGVPVEPILEHIKAMRQKGWATADLVLASESYAILKTARQQLPDLELSFVENWSGVRASWVARRLNIRRLSMNHRALWSGYNRLVTRKGYIISAYTVNKPRIAKRLAKSGVQAIFTDFPDLFETK